MDLDPLNLRDFSTLTPEATHGDGRLHGARQPRFVLTEEKPWHYAAAMLFARGEVSAKEVAEAFGVSAPTVYNLMRQTWFQERITKLMHEQGGNDIMALFKGELYNSLTTLVEIRDDEMKPSTVRRACAVDILDRALGKPKQQVEVSGGAQPSDDPVAEAARLEQQNNLLKMKTTSVAVRAEDQMETRA